MTQNIKSAVALGFFDGLHVAHRAVLNAALEQQNLGLRPTVLLFDKHPLEVLTGRPVARLMPEPERRAALRDMGFTPEEASFAAIRNMEPASFFTDILLRKLNAGFVSCGFNYTFGKGGKGGVALLRTLCRANGVDLRVCEPVERDGEPVSSTAVRRALTDGDPRKAAAMLGRPFGFSAPVFAGDRRGRELDAPTANQLLPEGLLVPRFGVYAAVVTLPDGRRCAAVTNIGCRPTFDGKSVRSESHLLDFSGDLYGKTLRVELWEFIRPERVFPSFDAIREQIAADAARARSLLPEEALH